MTSIAEIKASHDLCEEIEVDLGLPLRQYGRWLSWVCPFHDDWAGDGGSLRIVAGSEKWRCFSCGQHGDVVDWLKLRGKPMGVGTRTAKQAQVATPVRHPWAEEVEDALANCVWWLWSGIGNAVRDYLRRRGLTDATIITWGLGYNPVPLSLPGVQSPDGSPARLPGPGIIIPIRQDGKLEAVKIRMLGPAGRYTQLIGSLPSLYGTQTIGQPVTVLCEGEFDAMLMRQETGVTVLSPTVGARYWDLGWSKYIVSPTLLVAYDNDPTGEGAARDMIGRYPRARRLLVPAGKDITDFLVGGGNLQEWLENALRSLS